MKIVVLYEILVIIETSVDIKHLNLKKNCLHVLKLGQWIKCNRDKIITWLLFLYWSFMHFYLQMAILTELSRSDTRSVRGSSGIFHQENFQLRLAPPIAPTNSWSNVCHSNKSCDMLKPHDWLIVKQWIFVFCEHCQQDVTLRLW